MGVVSMVEGFLSDDFNKVLLVCLLILGFLAIAIPVYQPSQAIEGESFIHFFYSPNCPHCHEQIENLNPLLEARYEVTIIYHDVTTLEGNELFLGLCSNLGLQGGVPTTLVGEEFFVGYSQEIGEEIEDAVKDCSINDCIDPLTGQTCSAMQEKEEDFVIEVPFLGETNLNFMSLPTLAIVMGLVDGFNPCAMWVLVYLIAMLAGVQDKKRVLLIVGSFVAASGILYFLFMTAWLNAFMFMGYTRAVSVIIGLVALGAGILHVKEYLESRNKALTCKVTDAEEKKKTMDRVDELVHSPITWGTIAGIIVLAFVVNSIEFVCSAALPAIFTQILALAELSFWEYYGYIALYDLAFMLDDLVIFGLAVFSMNAMSANEKYVKASHIIGGLLLLVIGALLLFAPQLLI